MNKSVEPFEDKDLQLHYDVCVGIGLLGGQTLDNALVDAETVRLYSKLPVQNKYENYYLNRYIEYSGLGTEKGVIAKKTIASVIQHDFDNSPESFFSSLQVAMKAVHGEYLAPRSLAALCKIQTFKVKGVNAGFALTGIEGRTGLEIVSVHNQSGIPGLGTRLMIAAISLKGNYLECFGPYLNGYYGSYQFKSYKEIPEVKMANGRIQTIYRMKLNNMSI
jgi:hypothetical protein